MKSRFLSALRNNHGMSMVELAMVGGMGTLIALGMGQMLTNSAKEQKKLSMAMDMNNTQSILTSVLMSDASCGPLLTGKPFQVGVPTVLTELTFGGNTLSNTVPLNGWLAESIQLVPGTHLQDITNAGVTKSLYDAHLKIKVVRTNTALGTGERNLSIPLRVLTQPAPATVVGCYGEMDSTTQSCAALGGTYNPPPMGSPPGIPGTCVPDGSGTGTLAEIQTLAAIQGATDMCGSLGGQYTASAKSCLFGADQLTLGAYLASLAGPGPGPSAGPCFDAIWVPDTNTVKIGVAFTQTSNCAKTRNAVGTKPQTYAQGCCSGSCNATYYSNYSGMWKSTGTCTNTNYCGANIVTTATSSLSKSCTLSLGTCTTTCTAQNTPL